VERKHVTQERRALYLFLLVANLWTWALWIPPLLIATRMGLALPSPNNYVRLASEGFAGGTHVVLAAVFSLAVYGPLIGAIVAMALEQGRRGVRELLAGIVHIRVAVRWYLVALAIAAFIAFVPAAIAWLTGNLVPPSVGFGSIALLIVPLFALQLLTSGLGEEPGWRGYVLPRLQQRMDVERSVWVLGLIWAAWHYPLTSIYVWQGVPDGTPVIGAVIAVVVGLVGQTMGVIGITYIYVWLFNRTRSIFLMIVFHALSNTLPLLVPAMQGALVLLTGLSPWIVVLVLQRTLGKARFP
jgi:uncharacterized protein